MVSFRKLVVQLSCFLSVLQNGQAVKKTDFLSPQPFSLAHTLPRDQLQDYVDTSGWLGTNYIPSSATSPLAWWAEYDAHRLRVEKELQLAHENFGLTAIRVFLHSLTFLDSSGLIQNVQPKLQNLNHLLTTAEKNGMRVGIVLFDDAWNHTGTAPGSELSSCTPVKGQMGACWMSNPQDWQRANGTAPFETYLKTVVGPLREDHRILFWEVYNEPCSETHCCKELGTGVCTRPQIDFAMKLRRDAYGWLSRIKPTQPILSSWDWEAESVNPSAIRDVHRYDADFKHGWTQALFKDCSRARPGQKPADPAQLCRRGAVVTEAGCRWVAGGGDAGAPLGVLNFLKSIETEYLSSAAPFRPGVFLAWELMVGKTNTRWTNSDPKFATQYKEPAIPWCGLMFPDGTPVSDTEAYLIRQYANGASRSQPKWIQTSLPSGILSASENEERILHLAPGLEKEVAVPSRDELNAAKKEGYELEITWKPGSGNVVLAMQCRNEFIDITVGTDGFVSIHSHAGLVADSLPVTVEGGILMNSWNLLRARLLPNGKNFSLEVWINPQLPLPALGRLGIWELPWSSGAALTSAVLKHGEVSNTADRDLLVDYISVLPDGNVKTPLHHQNNVWSMIALVPASAVGFTLALFVVWYLPKIGNTRMKS